MLRCAIVPPVPVPYREELFERLAARGELELQVIYQAGSQASWDQARGWFPELHRYPSRQLRSRHLARPGRSPVTWPRRLEAALSAFDPAVVVVSEFGPATLRCLAWARPRRRAVVVLTEVTREGARSLARPQRIVHRALARRVDGFIAVSSAARDRVIALGVAPDSVSVSLQAVAETALLAAAAARRPVQEQPPRLLSVARLVADKQLGTLIEAFGDACLAPSHASLQIVGGGPLEGELRALAQRRGLPVDFGGAVSAAELPARYAHASAFVLPSRYEPFGVSLREAVLAGLPVICSSAVGAAADLARDGENAIVLAPGDRAALAEALARVCREPELRARMGAASRALAERHTLARDVEAFVQRVSSAAQAVPARR
ncbi:MAG: glycosyltransferase family 4 protein [Solirubrobacteraceae bacterium]